MHSTIFGGVDASLVDNDESNKKPVVPLPTCFLHDSDQLIDLAFNDKVGDVPNNTAPIIPCLAYTALKGLVKLNGSISGTSIDHGEIDYVKTVFNKGGSVFYAGSSCFNEMKSDISKQRNGKEEDLKNLSGEDFGVLNIQHVTKHVYLSIVICMKNGASIVPGLMLGDEAVGI